MSTSGSTIGHEALFLAKGGVSRQRVRVRAYAAGTRQIVGDVNDRPPLREARAHGAVL
jgi:hypothetical protein